MKTGGTMPCIMNASNEIAVDAFLSDRIGFYDISSVIEKTMERIPFMKNPGLHDYQEADREAEVMLTSLAALLKIKR
jgi:1-deoxy-D-xylulose-5-phosphate reductoisomerase